jgi:mannose-6-phosphate isomerase-like protein (cupin superfamily)
VSVVFPTSSGSLHARPRLRGASPSPHRGSGGASSRTARAALAHHLGEVDPLQQVDLTVTERSWQRVGQADGADLWLITWPPGASTGWHDHGAASGAFVVLHGSLTEYVWTGVATATTLAPHTVREFGGRHIHDVVNTGDVPAVSLHAYAPSLAAMTRYEVVRGRLQVTGVEQRGELW